MFSSTAATIEDDTGDHLGVGEDFDKEVYKELIELYTNPVDWIINMQIATGRVAIENFHTVIVQKILTLYNNSDPLSKLP